MPTYEYKCQKCEKNFEYFQKITEDPKKKCEKCGGKLERLISGGAFQLKGGGWYADGYASTGGKSSESKPKTESKSAEKKS